MGNYSWNGVSGFLVSCFNMSIGQGKLYDFNTQSSEARNILVYNLTEVGVEELFRFKGPKAALATSAGQDVILKKEDHLTLVIHSYGKRSSWINQINIKRDKIELVQQRQLSKDTSESTQYRVNDTAIIIARRGDNFCNLRRTLVVCKGDGNCTFTSMSNLNWRTPCNAQYFGSANYPIWDSGKVVGITSKVQTAAFFGRYQPRIVQGTLKGLNDNITDESGYNVLGTAGIGYANGVSMGSHKVLAFESNVCHLGYVWCIWFLTISDEADGNSRVSVSNTWETMSEQLKIWQMMGRLYQTTNSAILPTAVAPTGIWERRKSSTEVPGINEPPQTEKPKTGTNCGSVQPDEPAPKCYTIGAIFGYISVALALLVSVYKVTKIYGSVIKQKIFTILRLIKTSVT